MCCRGTNREGSKALIDVVSMQQCRWGLSVKMDLGKLAESFSERLWPLQQEQVKEVCARMTIPTGNVTPK